MESAKGLTLGQARVLLVEGTHEVSFFNALIAERRLDPYQVLCPQPRAGNRGGGGRGEFREFLSGLPAFRGFENIKGILIVTDNDNNPRQAFAEVRNAIEAASPISEEPLKRYSVPAQPYTIAGGDIKIAVATMPGPELPGALESLCLAAARNALPRQANCVDAFVQCADVRDWQSQQRDKLQLRALIGASYRRGSDLSLANLWSEKADLIPLKDVAFNGIADYLNTFSNATNQL